jgi:hypothetical protein
MIVQRQLSDEERLKILNKARCLEASLSKVDEDASEICQQINSITAEYEARILSYLLRTGLSDRMGVDKVTEKFSGFTPQITYETLTAAGTITREHLQAVQENGYPPNNITDAVNDLMMEYGIKRADMDGDMFVVGTAQMKFYMDLLDLTMAEMPFTHRGTDNVTLYTVSTPGFLFGIHGNLRESTRDDTMFLIKLDTFEQLRDISDAYMVTRPSAKVPAALAMTYVMDKLQQAYDKAHPEIAKKRMTNKIGLEGLFGPNDEIPQIICTPEGMIMAIDVPMTQQIFEMLQGEEGRVSLEKYREKCPSCAFSEKGCLQYRLARMMYDGHAKA